MNRTGIVLALLLVTAAAVRIFGISWGLPQIYEEATPLTRAWALWGWGTDEGFHLDPRFFHYPSLTIYLQFLVQVALYGVLRVAGTVASPLDFQLEYALDATWFYVAGRAVSALFAVGTVALVFLTGRRVGGVAVGALAAGLLALNAFHIEKSQTIEVDVVLTFFVTLALGAAFRVADAPTGRNVVLAGLALGLATSAKYTGALLIAPLALATWLGCARAALPESARSDPDGDEQSPRPKTWLPPARLLLTRAAWLAGAAALAFALTSPYVLLDFDTAWKTLEAEGTHMRVGHFGSDEGGVALGYYTFRLVHHLLAWPPALLAVAGMILLGALRRSSWALITALFVLLSLGAVGSWTMRADRYVLPILPAAFLLGSAAAVEILSRLRIPRAGKIVVAGIVLAGTLAPQLPGYAQVVQRSRPDTRTQAKLWIEDRIPPGSMVVSEMYGPALFGPLDQMALPEELRERVRSENRLYAVQVIPLFQVSPELTAPFYAANLYAACDYVVTSGAVRDRYAGSPSRFPRQVELYRFLEEHFIRERVFEPRSGPGPVITLYRNPAHEVPFDRRPPGEIPELDVGLNEGRLTLEEASFYLNLGLNHETFDFPEAALRAYGMGLRFPRARPQVRRGLVLGAVRCLGELDRWEEALRFLAAVAREATSPAERAANARLRREIETRIQGDGPGEAR